MLRALLTAARLAASAAAIAQQGDASPSPVRMNPENMAGLGLTPIPNDGFTEILVEGELEFTIARLFQGAELQVVVVESTPAKTDHRTRPTDGDEFVYVLSGKLILTEPNGTLHEYVPGDALVLPLGYAGTWEMQGNYREIAVLAQ